MRTKNLLSTFAAWLLTLTMLLGAASAQAQWAPLPLSNPDLSVFPRGAVWTIARQPDGGIVFGGDFTAIDGQPHGYLARLKPDGTLDPQWNPSANGLVRSLVVDQSTGAIYVGGQFTQIGGQSRNRIAKLAANGAVDASWNPSASDIVYVLALHSSGALYAGGAFDQIGGLPRNRIAKLATGGTGAADANWNPSADDVVRALALGGGDVVYAGGYFNNIGGHPRKFIAKLAGSGSGAADANWNPSAAGVEVWALAVDGSGAVFAGGRFFGIGGQSRNNIAKLAGNGTGAADANWDASADNLVTTLAVDSSGAVFAGGDFFTIGGQPRTRLAKLAGSGTGAADASWNAGAQDRMFTLNVGNDGVIYAGGYFQTVGTTPRAMIAALPTTVIWRTLTYTAGANGTIDGTSPQTVLNSGDGTAVTAVPNANYTFVQWSDGSTANPRTDRDVTANISVAASFAPRGYLVSANATPGGTVTPTVQTVSHGATATFTIVPDAGMQATASGCGGSLSGNIYTTGVITASCAISVSFGTTTYTVTATAGANGTITPASRTVYYGTVAGFTVTPAAGYRATVSGCGGSLSGNTYITAPITADCTVTASFTLNSYTVTANAGANGSITPALRTVNHGATTTFTVTPAANYQASVVGCGGSLSGNVYTTGPIAADCTVTASFAPPNTYIVTAIAGANGTITPPSQTVNPGATTTFTVTPAANYRAVVSGCGGNLSGNVYTTGPVTAHCTVTAIFAPPDTYTVTAIAGSNGAITPASQTVSPGATTTFTVTPAANYRADVSGCGGSLSGNVYTTGPITADCLVTATFPPITYTVTAAAGPYGAVIPASQIVRQGASTTFDIQTYPAYHVSSATGCGGSLSGTVYTTGAITADCHVAVSFAIDTFVVTATAGANGSITPASQTVEYNATAIFTVTPAVGYRANVSDCGGILSGNTYSVGGVGGNCAVHATFVPDPSNLSLTIDAGRDYARYGQGLSYVISLTNLGATEANPVSITMVMPPQLDAGNATWVCNNAVAGAQCTASGRGAVLRDPGVVLPAGHTLTWLVSVPVRPNATGSAVEALVSAGTGGFDVSASDRFTLVIARDGFEANGDGARGEP